MPSSGVRACSRVHIFVLGQDDTRGEEAATKVDFRQGGRDDFLEAMRLVLQRKEWLHNPTGAKGGAGANPGVSTSCRHQLTSMHK